MSEDPNMKQSASTETNDAISSISAIAYGFMGSQIASGNSLARKTEKRMTARAQRITSD